VEPGVVVAGVTGTDALLCTGTGFVCFFQ
jgi:hypothetical protein